MEVIIFNIELTKTYFYFMFEHWKYNLTYIALYIQLWEPMILHLVDTVYLYFGIVWLFVSQTVIDISTLNSLVM